MKIRNSFVSNSSSSSFIVPYKDGLGAIFNDSADIYLTEDEASFLEKCGFKKVNSLFPSGVAGWENHEYFRVTDEESDIGYYYEINCNQETLMADLVKLNVGFIGSCHYGDYTVIFRKGEDYLMIFRNYGNEVEVSAFRDGWDKSVNFWENYSRPAYEKVSTKKYLEDKDSWLEEV